MVNLAGTNISPMNNAPTVVYEWNLLGGVQNIVVTQPNVHCVTKQQSHRCGSVTKEIKRDQEDVSITVCVHHRLCPTAPVTGII